MPSETPAAPETGTAPSRARDTTSEPTDAAPSEAPVDRITELTDRTLAVLDDRIVAFRGAVAAAEHEVADEVARRSGEEDIGAEQALIELGPFAVGRIDADRFARLLGVAEAPLTPEAVDVLDRADRILRELVADPVGHVVEVERGGDLRDAVKDALARFGRAYGAARAVELARAGTFDEMEHGHLLGPLPFRLWNRTERRLAPPLIVRVRGEDCRPAGLGEFLDGSVVLVLVVQGPATPAPLSRLVTPGTFVLQTADAEELGRLAENDHPAVALLFDSDREGQAYFVHDPEAGGAPWERLSIGRMPSDADVGRGRRAPVWLEEVEHLRALAEEPRATGASPVAAGSVGEGTGAGAPRSGTAAPGGASHPDGTGTTPAPPVDPADRLAALLLARAGLDDG